MTRPEVKAKAVESIEYAKSHGLTVEFSCEDATRTDLPFLKEMHLAVQAAKVDKINMPDTVGTMSPPAMEYLVKEVMPVTKVPLRLHCHDDFGLAVANSMAGVRYGARQIHVCDERAGGAGRERRPGGGRPGPDGVLRTRTNVDSRKIGYVSKLVTRLTGVADTGQQGDRREQRLRA